MREADIRPLDILTEYLRLSAADAERFFDTGALHRTRPCPACDASEADNVIFQRLPKDVLGYMVAMLPAESMKAFALSCQTAAAAVHSDAHWHRRHLAEFGETSVQPAPGTSWLDVYRARHEQEQINLMPPRMCLMVADFEERCSTLSWGPLDELPPQISIPPAPSSTQDRCSSLPY